VQLGLNRKRGPHEAVLYTPAMVGNQQGFTARTTGGASFALTSADGAALSPGPRIGEPWRLMVLEAFGAANPPLVPGQAVLSLGPDLIARRPELLAAFETGAQMEIRVACDLPLATAADAAPPAAPAPPLSPDWAISGGTILLVDGVWPNGPRGLNNPGPRHPRSMIAWNDQHVFMVVIDGRQISSIGMTYPEMAALALHLGATHAFELDGGGSSTLWAAGRVLNQPSALTPRPVANALVYFPLPIVGP